MENQIGCNGTERDLQAAVNSLTIKSPCSVSWLSMEGSDTVRFCGQCKKNVHNLTNMSREEVRDTIDRSRDQSLCVFMYRREDGTVALDNCPSLLRPVRNRLRASAAALLIILIWSLPASAQDMSLVNAVRSTDFSNVQYIDRALHITTGVATAIAFVLGLFVPYRKRASNLRKQAVMEWLALALVPILTFSVGSWLIDSLRCSGGNIFS